MKQKILSLFTVITILMSLLGIMPIIANAENTPIELGACLQMGTYDGQPILWRCVAFEKVIGTDENGIPIIDSTQTATEYRDGYLPLMFADTAICEKPFDAAGADTNTSHGRSETRTSNGSNYWADSNIRDWLNSSAPAGNITWSCGNAPSYSDEAGFLSHFTDQEKAVMNAVTQKSLLAEFDKDITGATGSEAHTYENSILEVVQNYRKAYSEQVTDTMFLLDVQQIENVYHNLGDYYEPYGHILYYWLRTPISYHDYLVRIAFLSGEINLYPAQSTNIGVRPAFYLNPSSFLYGSGTRKNPHTVVPTHIHDMFECENENVITFDHALTSQEGELYIDGVVIEPTTESDSSCIVLPAGNYYLAENVSIHNCIEIKGNVNLCLNSKTLNMGESGITVCQETGIFNLCDCGEDGTITSAYHTGFSDAALITAKEKGVFSLYSGKVINTSDKKYSYKQTLSALDGVVKLYGGEIVSLDDNAVYFGNQAESIILSGAPKIKGSHSKSDIYLRNNAKERLITIVAPLSAPHPYRIGALRTEVFTNNWDKYMADKNPSDFFVSAKNGRCINKNENGELEICDYVITEQPSESNSYTVTANGSPVSYVWYPATEIIEEVTDQNASAYEYNDQTSVYNSTNGWTSANGVNSYYFKINLSEGDIIKVKPSVPLDEFVFVSLTNISNGEFQDVCYANSEGEYIFTAVADAEYSISVEGILSGNFPTVTATTLKTILGSAVDSQTTNTFTGNAGSYLCEITYVDGTVLRSNIIETVKYYDYSIRYENGQAVVMVPLDSTYTVIFASYDAKGKLISVDAENIPLAKGENQVVPPTDFETTGTVKVMLWDTDNMKPLCAADK